MIIFDEESMIEEDSDSEDNMIDNHSRLCRVQGKGLPNWKYESPFQDFSVSVDDVDKDLEKKFIAESNKVLDNVCEEVESQKTVADSRECIRREVCEEECTLTVLEAFDAFCPPRFIEKLRAAINRTLCMRNKKPVTVNELRGIIILHVLCASYSESPSTVCCEEESDTFLQMPINADRYNEVWSALSCSSKKRSRVEREDDSWSTRPTRGNTLIMEIEEKIASINRDLVFVKDFTIFSLDDDHHRLSSRAVTLLTNLSSINNPAKALGPVSNALCSALVPILIACHHSRPREKLIDVWSRLVQLVQGAPTPGSLSPMTDAVFAADRGYNSQETIKFLSKTLGATGFGTHKRSLDFPFIFGDGPINRRHKGMSVSEKGFRSIYSATSKEIKSNGRVVRAAVYRESYSGRIAAMYHNNDRLFKATKFTLVPRDNFRGEIDARKIYELQVVYDGQERGLDRSLRPFSLVSDNVGRMQVDRILQRVIQLTFLQSEDPSWHLLRAFMFPSRTSHNFLRAVYRNYENNLVGLARILKGKRIAQGVVHLPRDEENVKEALHKRWDIVLDCLKMKKDSVDEEIDLIGPSSIISLSDSAINALTKPEIGKFLTAAVRRPAAAFRKPELVERLKNLRDAVSSGEITLPEPQVLSEDETVEEHASDVASSLMQASLESWLMNPLVATTGMKEGTMNEIEVLHNLPNFFRCEQQLETGENSTCTDMNMFVNDTDTIRFKIDFIRSVGLLSNRQNPMLGDSPDGLCAITDSDGGTFSAALEVKTMTSADTIEHAKTKKHEHGGFIVVDDIGLSRSSNTSFQEIVDKSQYPLQCLHHAAVCQVSTVLFVVAKGGTAARGGIIFVTVLNFSETIKNAYLHCLDSVRVAAFEWVGRPSSCIPTAYDGLLSNTHATDIYSLSSYYSLGNALRQHII